MFMVEKHILSKSSFIKGHQCLKQLYLSKKRPFLRDKITAEQRAKFKRGHTVGHLAHQLFPGGIDVSPKSPSQFPKAVEHTQKLIEQGKEVIYEATFQSQQVLVMLDILRKTPEGWVAYEIKSSKSLSATYYTDAALQHYVITQSGLPLHKFYLVYVDVNYQLHGSIDVHSFFKMEEVSASNLQQAVYIEQQIAKEKQVLLGKHSPKIDIGTHCFVPYKCDFVGFCWKKVEKKSYLPPQIKIQQLPNLVDDVELLSLSCAQQVVPKCEGQQPYRQQLIAYKMGNKALQIAGASCAEQQAAVQHFFEDLKSDTHYLVYDKALFSTFLEDMLHLYPHWQDKAKQVLYNTIGVLELLEAEGLCTHSDRQKLTWLYWQKLIDSDNSINLKPIASDAEAFLWYEQQPNLLLHIPDKDLIQYFNNKHRLLQGIASHMQNK